MCVLYTSVNKDKKDLEINYVIETLTYLLPHREILLNLSFFLTNSSENDRSIRIVHRKTVDDLGHLDLNDKADKDLLNFLCDVYGDRLSVNLESRITEFYCKPKEFAGKEDHLENFVFKQNLPLNEDLKEEKSSLLLDKKERWTPYTSIRIGNFPAKQKVFCSLNMVIKGDSFDYLLGGVATPSISGANALLKNIKYDDLSYLPKDSPWHLFFESEINRDDRIIKPKGYDILIQNKQGTLPKCYRVGPNIHEEFIENRKLASKVVWFSSHDPNQDFTIEVLFSDKDNEILHRSRLADSETQPKSQVTEEAFL